MTKKHYLTPNEVAEILMVSPVTVRQWASKGFIEAMNTPGGHRRFTLDEVKRFAEERGIQIPEEKKTTRILIVDDDPHVRNFIKEILLHQMDNVEVKDTGNGFEAGRIVQAFEPDVILLDLMMPGINGFSVCKQLKEDPHTRSMRVVAMTGYYTADNAKRIKQAGAECCLKKPLDVDELIGIISSKPAN